MHRSVITVDMPATTTKYITVNHRKTEVKDRGSSHQSTLEGKVMAWGERKEGKAESCTVSTEMEPTSCITYICQG